MQAFNLFYAQIHVFPCSNEYFLSSKGDSVSMNLIILTKGLFSSKYRYSSKHFQLKAL